MAPCPACSEQDKALSGVSYPVSTSHHISPLTRGALVTKAILE